MDESIVRAIVREVLSQKKKEQIETDLKQKDIQLTKGIFCDGEHRTTQRYHMGGVGPTQKTQDTIASFSHKYPYVKAVMRFLEEIGIFMIDTHVWVKHLYRRRSDLKIVLENKIELLNNRRMDIQVYAGESLVENEIKEIFTSLLPVITSSVDSDVLLAENDSSIKSIRVGILNCTQDKLYPKICIVTTQALPRSLKASKLDISLGYYPESQTLNQRHDALCNVYKGGIESINMEEFSKELTRKMIKSYL